MGCTTSSHTKNSTDAKKAPTELPPSTKPAASAVSSGTRSLKRPSTTKNINPDPTRKFQDFYTLGDLLGQGTFSFVKIGFRISDNLKVAVKIVSRVRLHPEDEINLIREIEIMRSLDHPHIVKVIDFFEDPAYYYAVLEYIAGGELFDRLVDKATYTENEARDVALTIFQAIKYIHDRNIVHRDIKPENILLLSKDDDTTIKLTDFGFAIQTNEINYNKLAGTPGYVSPEVLERKPHGKPVDMWAMGVVLYMLLGGYPPFYSQYDDDQRVMYRRILAGEYSFHPEYWANVTDEAKTLIRGLLIVNPDFRMTVDEVLSHPWLLKPKEELALINLSKNITALKDYRQSRAAKLSQAFTSAAVDTIRKLSNANLATTLRSANLNDIAIDVIRKVSNSNISDAIIIEAARKRSGINNQDWRNSAAVNSNTSSRDSLSSLNSTTVNSARTTPTNSAKFPR